MTNRHMLKTSVIKLLLIISCLSVGDAIAQEATSPVAVSVTTARRGTIVSAKQYTGHLEPQAEVQVFANVSGKIVALGATVGQNVAKGDVLAETDSSEATLVVIRAESALSSAQSRLTATQANAQARVESQLAVAQETLMTAQAQLTETNSLAEMRIRNQLVQAEVAYQASTESIEKSKTNAEQSLTRAKVELDKTQLDFERTKSLHEKQHVSDSDFEAAENRLKVAQTRYEEAVVTAKQFQENARHPSVERTKAELEVAQKLVEIRGWEREIALAESKVTQAQADFNAAQKLVEAKSWEHEIENARAGVSQAEEQLKIAREQLSNATIKSPINGIIATRHSNVGDHTLSATSPAGKPIFTVIGVDSLTAVWNKPIRDARRINTGELVLISTNAGIQNIVGTIDFISPTVDRENNTVLVQATVPNAAGSLSHNSGLKPGGTITVSIKTSERKNVQLLPMRAVLHIQNGSGTIFTVRENAAHREQINVGAVYGGEIEITSRLINGTQVIVSEQHRLQEGTPVSIIRD
ncbi:MAG: efflux RND transporter periplasmic adaptor subunit [Candidatus Poribacteria bacterium]|nr:efflux RND transporter periplasmic adaptor subunit [Candidatus Poribacteria bacterium]